MFHLLPITRCQNGTCAGIAINERCGRSQDCEPGLFCDTGFCKPYKNMSQYC
jgi:hypothetical protein